jgi:hypothetical protein
VQQCIREYVGVKAAEVIAAKVSEDAEEKIVIAVANNVFSFSRHSRSPVRRALP